MRVLLAEDDEMNVELFAEALHGYDVVVARDGAQALERALTDRFDMYVLDVQMPKVDGYEVCRTLRARGVRAPILALTAAAMPGEVLRGRAAGFDAYLTKPISPSALRSAISAHTRTKP